MKQEKFWLHLLAGIRTAITSAINEFDDAEAGADTGPAFDQSTTLGQAPPDKLQPETVDQLSNELLSDGAVLDSEGLPWDIRIHSSGKTFYKKDTARAKGGSWKLKKGVSDAVIEAVCAELRATHPAPGGGSAEAPLAPGAPVGTVAAPGALPGSTVVSGQTLPPAPPELITSWAKLLEAATKAGFTHELMNASCLKFGVADIFELQNSPALVPTIAKDLGL